MLIILGTLLVSCTNTTKTSNASKSSAKRNSVNQSQVEPPLTDSAKLVKHLDSLMIPKFPLNTENSSKEFKSIGLSSFKHKPLMNIPLKLRERDIGGSIIDGETTSSTFDLADTAYNAKWILIARKPHYFSALVDGTLVTMSYDLKVIDAIHVAANDPAGNNHFHGILNPTVYKDLKLTLHYYFEQQMDEDSYAHQIEDDFWFVDQKGHFKLRRTKVIEDMES